MKTMKTKNLILGMVVAVGILFTSCSQNDQKETTTDSNEKAETMAAMLPSTQIKAELYGRVKCLAFMFMKER